MATGKQSSDLSDLGATPVKASAAADLSDLGATPAQPDAASALSLATGISAAPPTWWQRIEAAIGMRAPQGSAVARATGQTGTTGTPQLISPEAAMTPSEQQRHPIATGLGEVAGSLTSPENVALMAASGGLGSLPGAAGRIIPRLASGVFSEEMLRGAYNQYPDFRRALDAGDTGEAMHIMTRLVATGALGLLAGRAAVKSRPTFASALAGEADALRPPAAETVPTDLSDLGATTAATPAVKAPAAEVPAATPAAEAPPAVSERVSKVVGTKPVTGTDKVQALQDENAALQGRVKNAPPGPDRDAATARIAENHAMLEQHQQAVADLAPDKVFKPKQPGDVPLAPADEMRASVAVAGDPALAARLPAPGNAAVKAPGLIEQTFGTMPDVLRRMPETAPIADTLLKAELSKRGWIRQQENGLAPLVEGLSKSQREQMGELLDTFAHPDDALGKVSERFGPYVPDVIERATKARAALTDMWNQVSESERGNFDTSGPGFISNYLTHIEKSSVVGDLRNSISNILDFNFTGKTRPTGPNPLPTSRFLDPRTGGLQDYALDVSKIFPAYVESIARVLHDKPAIDQARGMLADVQESPLRDLAKKYVDNYARVDRYPQLNDAWNKYAQMGMNTVGRAYLSFSPRLQVLHAARLFVGAFPQMDFKYFRAGMAEVMRDPKAAWEATAQAGLLPNQAQRPSAFRTLGQKWDQVANYMSAVDFIDRSVGYLGQRKMYADKGMSAAEAEFRAADDAARFSFMRTPARGAQALTPGEGFQGAVFKTLAQFKQIPLAITETYARIIGNARENPAALAKLAFATAVLGGIEAGTGLTTLHFASKFGDPLLQAIGQSLWLAGKVATSDDPAAATSRLADHLIRNFVPGGSPGMRLLERGPGAFIAPDQPREKATRPTAIPTPPGTWRPRGPASGPRRLR